MNLRWTIRPLGYKWMERGIQPEDFIGFVSLMLDDADPDNATEQLHKNYGHGGGWRPLEGFKMDEEDRLTYPGDPAMEPLAEAKLRDERILVYPHAWFAVVSPAGDYEVSRMD